MLDPVSNVSAKILTLATLEGKQLVFDLAPIAVRLVLVLYEMVFPLINFFQFLFEKRDFVVISIYNVAKLRNASKLGSDQLIQEVIEFV